MSKTDGWAATAADRAISRVFSQHFKLAVKTGVYIPQLRIRRACAEADLSLAMQMWGLKTRRQAGEQRGALALKLVTSKETLSQAEPAETQPPTERKAKPLKQSL